MAVGLCLSCARPCPPNPPAPALAPPSSCPRSTAPGRWRSSRSPLGLIAAPSLAGAALAVSLFAAFLGRRPFKTMATGPDRDRRRAAWPAAAVLSVLAVVAFAEAVALGGVPALWPLLLCVPPGLLFAGFDLRGDSRAPAAELAGSAAFALLPAAFATLSGWPATGALALAALMLARCGPTILYVRTYLRRAKTGRASAAPALLAATAAAAVTAVLVILRLAPVAALPLGLVLLARAGVVLGLLRPSFSARSSACSRPCWAGFTWSSSRSLIASERTRFPARTLDPRQGRAPHPWLYWGRSRRSFLRCRGCVTGFWPTRITQQR